MNELALKQIVIDFHWMARRYADGRQSYATGLFNDHTRALLAMGIELNPTGDGTIWAKDSAGRAYDGLTDEEANMGHAHTFEPGNPKCFTCGFIIIDPVDPMRGSFCGDDDESDLHL